MSTRIKGTIVFAASFIVPLLLLYVWFSSHSDDFPNQFLKQLQFENEIKITKKGDFLEINSDQVFTPEPGKDFLLLVWVRLSQLPVGDEKMHVLSYYDGDAKGHPGYALMIRRDADAVRPAIYWKDEDKQSRWHSFTKLPVFPKEWFFLALTYTEEKYLGLHVGAFDSSGEFKVKTLGGYELEAVDQLSDVPLFVGAIGTGEFKGKLGPIIIANLEPKKDRVIDVLSGIALDPGSVDTLVKSSERRLWLTRGLNSDLPKGTTLLVHPDNSKKNGKSAKKNKKLNTES